MSFWDFLEKHRQLVSGRLIVAVATIDGLNAAGAFHGLLGSDTRERWFGIGVAMLIAMVGSAVSGRAKETTAQVKVAEAMQTAINAQAGEPLPAEVTKLATPPASKPEPDKADLIVNELRKDNRGEP